jgi:hypothetical protein
MLELSSWRGYPCPSSYRLDIVSGAPEQVRLEKDVIDLPSITLPSRQFPGLLCFGAGFFNLILGATLIVSSSLAAADRGINGRLSAGEIEFGIYLYCLQLPLRSVDDGKPAVGGKIDECCRSR